MSTTTETSDAQLVELLRRGGPSTIAEIVSKMGVTATAVRQRLNRLMGQGLVERVALKQQRGRPSHSYQATEKARRQAGANFGDLSLVLWNELRSVADPAVRRGLLQRVAAALSALYRERIGQGSLEERMDELSRIFAERGIPLERTTATSVSPNPTTEVGPALPILRVIDCPYPELAEQDRGICAVERLLFQELLNHDIQLSQCRLDGHACCEFASN